MFLGMLNMENIFTDNILDHSEESTIGVTDGGILIKVFSNSSIPTPNFHFFVGDIHGCLSLVSPQYVLDSQYLPNTQLNDIIQFLSQRAGSHGFNPHWTNYEDCCYSWNNNNPKYCMEKQDIPYYNSLLK